MTFKLYADAKLSSNFPVLPDLNSGSIDLGVNDIDVAGDLDVTGNTTILTSVAPIAGQVLTAVDATGLTVWASNYSKLTPYIVNNYTYGTAPADTTGIYTGATAIQDAIDAAELDILAAGNSFKWGRPVIQVAPGYYNELITISRYL